MQMSAPAWPIASAMDRPIPELAPVTIAFWPLSNLRFSVFGTTGFGKSIKLFCEYGTLGLGRLAASGGIVGMCFLLFCGFVGITSNSLQNRRKHMPTMPPE